ncbi:hypothetical protein I352_05554 [Cryptococcus deuterogattii MMRL2647]|nr:hypothetical protein I352_05554 [Cryptococcus deuterogattii MMRL2647]
MSPTQYTASGCSVGSGNGDSIRSPTTPSPRRTRTSRPCTTCRSKKIKFPDVTSNGPCAFCSSNPNTTCEFVPATGKGYRVIPMRFGDNRLSIAAPFQARSSTVSCVPQNPSHYTQYPPIPSTQQLWEDAAPLQNSADYLCSQEVRGSNMASQLPFPPFTPSIHTAKDGTDTDESYFQLTGPPLVPQQQFSMPFHQQLLIAPSDYSAVNYNDDQMSYFEQQRSVYSLLDDDRGIYGGYGDPPSLSNAFTSIWDPPYPPRSEH